MKILLYSSHWPIDSELTHSWISKGHEIFFIAREDEWNKSYLDLPEGVKNHFPGSGEKVDMILVGNHTDAKKALILKFKRFWWNTPLFFVHWWFPFKDPIHRLVRNVSVTEHERDFLKSLQGIDSDVVYCPVDTDFFKPLPNFTRKKKAVAIGNGFKEREIMGYDHLINILENIHKIDPQIELKVLGNNEQKDYPDYVKVEYQNKEGLRREILESSAVFFTTTKNLIMNSLQIAMSSSREVVLFDLPSFSEVIDDGVSGHIIKDFDDELFSSKIVEICQKPNPEIGMAARDMMIRKCSRDKVTEDILSLIR